jgi:hypothetical protein
MKLILAFTLTLLFSFSTFARIHRQDRALVVISELDTNGLPEFEKLYTALEYLTKYTVQEMLQDSYEDIIFLNNTDATVEGFKNAVRGLAEREDIKAIDVILSLHGSPDRLYFKDRSWGMDELQTEFLSASNEEEQVLVTTMQKKLRIMYNLSCWGKTHNAAFYNMGFDVSTGSVNVNANSELEFVPMMLAWRNGISFHRSFWSSNNKVALFIADAPVRALGKKQNSALKETDSKKLFYGYIKTKISTDPR